MFKRSIFNTLLAVAVLLLLTGCTTGWQVRPTGVPNTGVPTEPLPTPVPTQPSAAPPTTTPTPTPTPSPIPPTLTTAPPTATPPPPTATPVPSPEPVRITFPAGGTSAIVTGSLTATGQHVYVLRASKNQILDVEVDPSGGQVLLEIWGADGSVLKHGAVAGLLWRGYLPATQDYFVSLIAEGGAAGYTMRVSIPERISFSAGGTSARVDGSVQPKAPDLFALKASAGQEMEVVADSLSPGTMLAIWGFDGTILQAAGDPSRDWKGTLPGAQDYFIYLYNTSTSAGYRLDVSIPPAGGEPPPVRIRFPAGATEARVTGSLKESGQAVYVLEALKNQLMDVQVDTVGGQVLLDIWGADGTVLKHGAVAGLAWRGYLPATQDYYLKLTAEQGSADYTLRVAIPERITFAPAGVSATVTGRVEIYGSMWYLVGAGGGQEMTIKLDVASDNILPTIYGVDGTVLKRYVDGQKAWTGTLPSTQDYFILISSYGDAGNFGLTVTIPSLGRQEIAPDTLCAGCVLPPA